MLLTTANPLLGRHPGRAGGESGGPDGRPGLDRGDVGPLAPRGLRGLGPADGDADAPAFRDGPAAGLTLPALPPDLPRTLTLRRTGAGAAVLAEALLAEGILRESDWTGSVGASLAAGIQRWVRETLAPAGDLRRIEIGLYWTDDVRGLGIDPTLWGLAGKGRDIDEPVGILALVSEEPESDRYPEERDVIVGRTVQEVEEARPGLGFQLLYLLQETLPPMLCTATPFWAFQQVMKETLYRTYFRPREAREINLIRASHGLTPDTFLETVPLAACEGEFRPGVIREALRHPLPDRLRRIVEAANEVLALSKAPKDTRRWDTHVLCPSRRTVFLDLPGGAPVESSFTVRWSAADPLPQIVDDFHHMIRHNGESTRLTWAQGWQQSNPAALRKTARNWRLATTLALKACALAEAMHADEEES